MQRANAVHSRASTAGTSGLMVPVAKRGIITGIPLVLPLQLLLKQTIANTFDCVVTFDYVDTKQVVYNMLPSQQLRPTYADEPK